MTKRNWKKHRPLFSTPLPREVRKPRVKWKILPILWYGFKRMCFVLGLMVFLSSVSAVYFSSMFLEERAAPSLPKEMVLYVEFDGTVSELPKHSGFSFSPGPPTVSEIVNTIDRAAADPRVKGLFARLNETASIGLVQIQEIREAVSRFRAAGKFAHIYSSSFGGSGGGLGRMYLASSFDERWMQPLGVVTIPGLKAEVPFFREVLDKIGVRPQFFKRKDFKTAYESVTDKSISKENRQMMEDLVYGIRDEILADMPTDLGIEKAAFEKMVNEGLFTAKEAEEAGLITHADYPDKLVRRMKEEIQGDPESDKRLFVGLRDYLSRAGIREEDSGLMNGAPFTANRPKVALVYAVGAIMQTAGTPGGPNIFDDGVAAADEIAPAILDAADDPKVEAIIIRIDSPGGSPTASESILRAIERAKEKDKKIIVSMGAAAASGGYWIATYADQIFAMPTTITGSIGVLGGKFSGAELIDKVGVNFDYVQWGRNAGMWSMTTPFDASEAQQINKMLDTVYEEFTARVSKGRGMAPEEVEKIAQGRVWMGRRAQEIGLVDQLGGLNDAMNYTAQLLGMESKDDLQVVLMPRPKTQIEMILEFLTQGGGVMSSIKIPAHLEKILSAMNEYLAVWGSGEPVLAYEPIRITD